MSAASQVASTDVREEDHVWVPVPEGLPEVEVPVEPIKAAQPVKPTTEAIESLAYQMWQERGCPIGSPEDDWLRAEAQLSTGT